MIIDSTKSKAERKGQLNAEEYLKYVGLNNEMYTVVFNEHVRCRKQQNSLFSRSNLESSGSTTKRKGD